MTLERATDRWDELAFLDNGIVRGYSSTTIPLTFSPNLDGDIILKLSFIFGDEKSRKRKFDWGSPTRFDVLVNLTASKVPVYVDDDIMDFQYCSYDRLYRKACRIRNRSHAALKAKFSVPRSLKGFVEFTPSVGFIQSHSYLDVQLKFSPKKGILEQIVKRGGEDQVDGDLLKVPITVTVPDQVLPVIFSLHAHVVDTVVTFSTKKIDFGNVPLNLTCCVPVSITNHSPIMEKIAFPNLPYMLKITPNDGFISVLPYRTADISVLYSPKSATPLKHDLVVMTKQGGRLSLPCRGKGVPPLVDFVKPDLHTPPVADGDEYSCYTVVTNYSKDTQTLEIVVPEPKALVPPPHDTTDTHLAALRLPGCTPLTEKSFLRVLPRVVVLKPGEARRLQVVFAPKVAEENERIAEEFTRDPEPEAEPEEELERGKKPKSGKKEKKLSAEEQLAKEEAERLAAEARAAEEEAARLQLKEERKRMARALEEKRLEEERSRPVNVIAKGLHVVYSSVDGDDDEPWSRHASHRIPCMIKSEGSEDVNVSYFTCHTTVVKPFIIPTPNVLNFGSVSLGQTKTLTFDIRNEGRETTDLVVEGLGVNSCFSVLNAVRPLEPGQARVVVVQFTPRKTKVEKQSLTILANKTKVVIPMTGRCTKPEVTLDPQGLIDVGDVMERETVEVPFQITNTSAYPFSYSIQPSEFGERNIEGFTEFHFVPGTVQVEPGNSLQVMCVFSPDHESSDYRCSINVGEHKLQFAGRCHARQVFLTTELDMPGGDAEAATDPEESATSRSSLLSGRTTGRPGADDADESDDALTLNAMVYQNPLAFLDEPIRAPLLGVPEKENLSPFATDDSQASVELIFDPLRHLPEDKNLAHQLHQLAHVGCCSLGKDGQAGSFEFKFEDPKDKADGIWKVTPETGAVKDGRSEVSLVFDREAYVRSMEEGDTDVLASMVGQWVVCKLQVILKGGVVPNGRPVQKVIDLKLKTYIDVP